MDKLEVCKETRKIAADSLYKILQELLNSREPISEIELRDRWLSELQKNPNIYHEGWYTPPPSGLEVCFATEEDPKRVAFESARSQESWPREDIFLDREKGSALLYASPVDKATGVIGDFGLLVYFGNDPKVKDHFKNIYGLLDEIFEYAELGMQLSEVYAKVQEVSKQRELVNDWWISVNDPMGINIGHTIPDTFEAYTNDEQEKIKNEDIPWQERANLISKKRKFVNSIEQSKIEPGVAFTVECRLKSSKLEKMTIGWFHTIAMFHQDGSKEHIKGFDEIFELVGMDYLLK